MLSQAWQYLSLLHKECLPLGLLWLCLPTAKGTLEVTEQCPVDLTSQSSLSLLLWALCPAAWSFLYGLFPDPNSTAELRQVGVSGDTCTFCNLEIIVLCSQCAVCCCCLGDAGCYLNIVEIQVTHLTGRGVKPELPNSTSCFEQPLHCWGGMLPF